MNQIIEEYHENKNNHRWGVYEDKHSLCLNGMNLKSKLNKIEGLHNFTHITKLKLTFGCIDQITGLEFLINLELLDLTSNKIRQIKGLKTLIKLRELSLASNPIKEIKGLDTLTKLEKLDLSGFYCRGIPEIKGLKTLINLRELNITRRKITEIKGLETLTKLKKLDLSDNEIDKIKGLETLVNLKILKFNRSICRWENDKKRITKIEGLKTLTKLEELDLGYNDIEANRNFNQNWILRGQDRRLDPDNTNLLSSCNSPYCKIEGLESLIQLVKLNLTGNFVIQIRGLNTLKNLKRLCLFNNKISKIENLEYLANLEFLGLGMNPICEDIRKAQIEALPKTFWNYKLKELDLDSACFGGIGVYSHKMEEYRKTKENIPTFYIVHTLRGRPAKLFKFLHMPEPLRKSYGKLVTR